jgi:hypothetical protein
VIIIYVAFAALLIGFPVAVAYQFAIGSISTRGLLVDKQLGGLSQTRVQVLLSLISAATVYAISAITAVHSGSSILPDIPGPLFLYTAVSNGIYVAGKSVSAARLLLRVRDG